MSGALLAHTLFLLTAAFAGVALGLAAFVIVRVRARDAFGVMLVRDRAAAGGPYRGGVLERLVARDAPLALRLIGACALGLASADALMHLALAWVVGSVAGGALMHAHRAEVGPSAGDSLAGAVRWAFAMDFPLGAYVVATPLLAVVVVVADASLVAAAVQLLRARGLGRRALGAILAGAVIARLIDVRTALSPPPALPLSGLDAIPGFVPLFLSPLPAVATWLVVRAGVLWARQEEDEERG